MSYAEFLKEDQRLVILRILNEMPSYSSNSSIIYSVLEQYGHALSRDQVKTHMQWLAEQGLINIDILGLVFVAHLTERGADVATGKAIVPGVKRPAAGA
ncbi:ArsR family transcriptional regulator [Orbaceae bacterium ESL0721]|nr:ArsR family transcriptional regulator [Orbaceae bacterium ESL0721]